METNESTDYCDDNNTASEDQKLIQKPKIIVEEEIITMPDIDDVTMPEYDAEEDETTVELYATTHPTVFYSETFNDIWENFSYHIKCPFCLNVGYQDSEYLKAHLRSKHYAFSIFCLMDKRRGTDIDIV